jgi:hypothetical protein
VADKGSPPVRSVEVAPNGQFAFVEFCDEALAETAMGLFQGACQ